ncbi:putative NADPH-dependent oxidoreductase [Paratrimastix pyriformis]|uniref:NADPH-dependent oxidoreductase n=1 Tax=Paratrimastix pyriformis TaxID=342808 RepID=A0ABQ8UXJ1_9EUKA|nr:putative NADPH-dependent oxidoreductase [Paratrimastix pyriformis]
MVKIIAVSGSTRAHSWNSSALAIAVRGAERAGATVEIVRLNQLNLPLYDGDYEAAHGLPADAIALKHKLAECDGILIASPEYNASISGVLKNHFIDWPSRPTPGSTEGPAACFAGKKVAVLAASPAQYGGVRGLVEVRRIFECVGAKVMPADAQGEVLVPKAHEVFTPAGECPNGAIHARLEAHGARFVEFIQGHQAAAKN